MDHLRLENYQAALSLLTRAGQMLEDSSPSVKLQAITLNNLGCYYKKTGKLGMALQYLHRALDLDATSAADLTNLAGTHLNVCAIHSTLSRHEVALKHAYLALNLMKDAEMTVNNSATLAIAYHNAGVEEEHLKNPERAAELYTSGYSLACSQLGHSHPLSISLKDSIREITETLNKQYRLGREKLPDLPKMKGHRRSTDSSYRNQSQSVAVKKNVTPDQVRKPIDAIKSAPGSSNRKRIVGNVRAPRVFRFTKHRTSSHESKPTSSMKLSTANLWNKLQKAAITIQRHWRGYLTRRRQIPQIPPLPVKLNSLKRRQEAVRMAKEALAEFEILKIEAISGSMLNTFQASKRKTFGTQLKNIK